ncbi:MAG: 50S ribosomal protein L32 [Deltaproteobacteria bacterium]|nr:50S ribosomal protein L32 [Deltaproteobacteria bacterium]
MSLPKRRVTRSKRNMRRANHDKVAAPTIVPCGNCGAMSVPHRVCKACGHYDGKEIVKKGDSEKQAG